MADCKSHRYASIISLCCTILIILLVLVSLLHIHLACEHVYHIPGYYVYIFRISVYESYKTINIIYSVYVIYLFFKSETIYDGSLDDEVDCDDDDVGDEDLEDLEEREEGGEDGVNDEDEAQPEHQLSKARSD